MHRRLFPRLARREKDSRPLFLAWVRIVPLASRSARDERPDTTVGSPTVARPRDCGPGAGGIASPGHAVAARRPERRCRPALGRHLVDCAGRAGAAATCRAGAAGGRPGAAGTRRPGRARGRSAAQRQQPDASPDRPHQHRRAIACGSSSATPSARRRSPIGARTRRAAREGRHARAGVEPRAHVRRPARHDDSGRRGRLSATRWTCRCRPWPTWPSISTCRATPSSPSPLTTHNGALQTSYVSPTGNHAGAAESPGGGDDAGLVLPGARRGAGARPRREPSSRSATRSPTAPRRRWIRTIAGRITWRAGWRRRTCDWGC